MKAEELVTEPLVFVMTTFRLEIIQYYIEDGLKRASLNFIRSEMGRQCSFTRRGVDW